MVNGQLTNNSYKVADAFNNSFVESVVKIAQSFPLSNINTCTINATEPAFTLGSVTETDVEQTIRSFKPSRTKDRFGMDTFMLKELGPMLIAPITKILNCSISESVFPNAWKKSAVIPIYKNGDPSVNLQL